MKSCENCRYWSQMVAHALGGEPVKALCLGPDPQQHKGQMVPGDFKCRSWAINSNGAWDEPPDYGATARAKYEAEEGDAK